MLCCLFGAPVLLLVILVFCEWFACFVSCVNDVIHEYTCFGWVFGCFFLLLGVSLLTLCVLLFWGVYFSDLLFLLVLVGLLFALLFD